MEKLSSILPSNPRVKSVDMEDAHPVRPGVQAYGRPVGFTAKDRDRISISAEAKERAFGETMAVKNPRESAGVQIAQEVSRKFFENRIRPHADEGDEAYLSEQIANSSGIVQSANMIADKTRPAAIQNNSTSAEESGNAVNKYA